MCVTPSFCMCCHNNLHFAAQRCLQLCAWHQIEIKIDCVSFEKNRKTPLHILSKEFKNRKILDKIRFVKDEYGTLFSCTTNPRCHLVFTGTNPCPRRIPAYPRQLTYANTLQILCETTFDCTLSGPFDNLFLT